MKLSNVRSSIAALAVLVSPGSGLQGQPQSSAPGALDSVVNVLKDPHATAIQKDALVGNVFAGVVPVEASHASASLAQRIYSGVVVFPGSAAEEPAVLIDVNLGRTVAGSRTLAFIKMRFSVPVNLATQASIDEATPLLKLRKGERIRLRGVLKDFAVTPPADRGGVPTHWANFVDGLVERTDQIPAAQGRPDFSGYWVLIDAAKPRGAQPSPTIADELTIRQTAASVTVKHPATAGDVPEAVTHTFGSHGVVGGTGGRFRSDVFWLGDQFVASTSTAEAPDAEGRQRTVEHSELWSLDAGGRLVVEDAERRSGVAVVSTSLIYKKR